MKDNFITHIEKCWKKLTSSTNEYFSQRDFETALRRYQNALHLAEVLNKHIPTCLRLEIPFMQVYIISCNNLANTYEELGNLEEAKNLLQLAVYFLLHLMSNEEVPADEVQAALKKAWLGYLHFAEQHNVGQEQQQKLSQQLQTELQQDRLIDI